LKPTLKLTLLFVATAFLTYGCATFRSDIQGEFTNPAKKNIGADRVSVLFVFSHYEQTVGWDAIPKLVNQNGIVSDFDNMFADALNEFSNVGRYATYTEYPTDVTHPERRALKDSLMGSHDFIIKITFHEESSFAKQFLGTIFSTITATLLPISYSSDYSADVDVYNRQQTLLAHYSRKASLSKWVETFLIFVYPFHPETRKREEIYINFMHNIFMQIETEGIIRN